MAATSESGVASLVQRWVAEGLLDPDQARAILEREPALPPQRGPVGAAFGRRKTALPLVIEALGYLGGLLALIGAVVVTVQLWRDATEGQLSLVAGVGAGVLLLAGAALRDPERAELARLRHVLWLLSTAALAATVALAISAAADTSPSATALSAALAAAAYGAMLWWRSRAPLQHLAVFVSLTTAAGTAVGALDDRLVPAGAGVAVWILALVWAVVAARRRPAPSTLGFLLGTVGALVGAQLAVDEPWGAALALVTFAGILAAGILVQRVLLVGVGAFGVLQVVPQVAARYLPTTVAAPLGLLVVGAVLLGVTAWLARRRKPQG